MKPGTLVKWKIGALTLTGRIVSNGGDMAQVQANGSTYEVTASELRAIPICLHCGRVMTGTRAYRNKFCDSACSQKHRVANICVRCGKHLTNGKSRYKTCGACRSAINRETSDNLVFAAIVEYKRQYDGASPDNKWLIRHTFGSQESIRDALARLAQSGRLHITVAGAKRIIMVVGGKWTYEEEK